MKALVGNTNIEDDDDYGLGPSIFVKQLGSNPIHFGKKFPISDRKGQIMKEWPEYLRVREFPK